MGKSIGTVGKDNGTVDTKGNTGTAGTAGTDTAGRSDSTGTTGNAGRTDTAGSGGTDKKITVKGETASEILSIKVPTPEAKKPRKPRKTTNAKKKSETADQISAVIQSMSALIASRPNMEQWIISKEEADSIAIPLNNLVAESEAFAKVAEHSDAFALIFACATVLLPRVMITIDKKKTEEKKKGVTKNAGNNENGKTVSNDRPNVKQSASLGKADDINIPAFVPSIM